MNATPETSAAYFLPPRADGADMTAAITEKLNAYGVCLLGSGTYTVCGVDLPEGGTLMGMGDCSRLLLRPDAAEGYAVKLTSFCCVKDLTVLGATEEIPLPDEVGERHGLLFRGTATTHDWMGQPCNAVIENCRIRSFTGGGLTCLETGYYIRSALTATNCHIFNCGAGINIPYFSEYHEFTNMQCCDNLYGCINNGGNNVYVNCGFNANKTGFVMDNTRRKITNDSHGSAIGCTFNHNGENKGIGILVRGARNGYVFSGCQMYYSKIVLEDTEAMHFNAFNIGRNEEIEVRGGRLNLFTDCIFAGPPIVTVEADGMVKFCNCFTRDGAPVEA